MLHMWACSLFLNKEKLLNDVIDDTALSILTVALLHTCFCVSAFGIYTSLSLQLVMFYVCIKLKAGCS